MSPNLAFSAKDKFNKMDKETAITTGIYKLSQDERAALLKWLQSSDIQITKINKTDDMGFESKSLDDTAREEIHTSIVGEFNGWHGDTTFTLDNGQVWKQTDKSVFYIPKKSSPDITVRPRSFGSWSLSVDGYSRAVKVKRIK